MTPRLKKLTLGIAGVALTIGLAACGGGGADEGATSASKSDEADQPPPAAKSQRPAGADQILTGLVVVDALASPGFHDMAKALATEADINPRYLTTIQNAIGTVKAGAYPTELAAAVDKLKTELSALEAALKAGNKDAAAKAAEGVHDAEHDYGKASWAWLATQAGKLGSDGEDVLLGSLAAVDIAAGAGFHDMAKAMAEATEVNPRDAGKATNVLTATNAATWSEALKAEKASFVTSLQALKTSVEAGNLPAAREAAEKVHDTEHDLSVAFYAWLGKQPRVTHAAGATHANLCSLKTADVLASAKFHDMAKALTEATEVNPRYGETAGKMMAVMSVMTWGSEEGKSATALVDVLRKLQQAAASGDLAGARASAEAIHDHEHDLSKGIYARMMAAGMGGMR